MTNLDASPVAPTGYASSGTSPGKISTLHLVGLGQVGRALLRRLEAQSLRLVAASDSSGTLVERTGLDALALERAKSERRPLASSGLAEDLPLELLVELVHADVLADASASRFDGGAAALERSERALRAGSRVCFASKDALAERAHAWRSEIAGGRIGLNAALGGTGRRLVAEFGELATQVEEIVLVANATTSCVLDEAARGSDWAGALRRARDAGLCEESAEADLDGRDAAAKLRIVAQALFGVPLSAEAIERVDVRSCRPRGGCTRLVARAKRAGRARVAPEIVPAGSLLAAPCDRVVYAYRLRGGTTRVHVGAALGPARCAEALLADVLGKGGAA